MPLLQATRASSFSYRITVRLNIPYGSPIYQDNGNGGDVAYQMAYVIEYASRILVPHSTPPNGFVNFEATIGGPTWLL
jgi:hypothetical protein